jgi:hypothetical protein
VARTGRSPLFTAAGAAALVYIVGFTAWGYQSLLPVYVVLATGALVAILSLGTRRAGGRP